MADILSKIVATKREEVSRLLERTSKDQLRQKALAADDPRDFTGAMIAKMAAGQPAVIAEIKRASPSRGMIREDFDAAAIAASYEAGGASCLSVLTDRDYFQGGAEYLVAARAACSLPVLRKDFIIDVAQIFEARAMGADAILLIASILTVDEMQEFEAAALDLGMGVLAEVHDESELDRVLTLGTPLIGINNRDLKTFGMDLTRALMLKDRIPPDRWTICESGIERKDDIKTMIKQGVWGFLIGEALMRATNPSSTLKAWLDFA